MEDIVDSKSDSSVYKNVIYEKPIITNQSFMKSVINTNDWLITKFNVTSNQKRLIKAKIRQRILLSTKN